MNKQRIEDVMFKLAEEFGLVNITKTQLCEAAGIPVGSFHHFMGCTFSEFVKEMRQKYPADPPDDITRARVNPEDRKKHIVAKALQLAQVYGFYQITQQQVAKYVGVSGALVTRDFTMPKLREAVLLRAIETETLEVIAQGMAKHHKVMRGVDPDLAARTCAYLLTTSNR
jgi:AcrR family transcriptional regulator